MDTEHKLEHKYEKGDIEFGAYIRELRLKRGLTIYQVAKRLNISINYVSQIERGIRRATDDLVVRFAKFYHIEEDLLFLKLERIPLSVRRVLLRNKHLQEALSRVYHRNLSTKAEAELIEEILHVIANYLDINGDHLP